MVLSSLLYPRLEAVLSLRCALLWWYALALAAQPACGQHVGSTFQRRFILGRGACATPGGGQGSYSEVWGLSHEQCAEKCLADRECVAYEYSTTKRYKLCEKHKEVPSHSVPVLESACFVLESALSLRTFKPFRGGDARYRGAVPAAGPLGWPPPPPAIVVPPRACGSPSSMPSSMPSSSSGGDGFAGCDLRLVQWDGLSVELVNLDGADLSGGSFTRAQFFRSTLRQAVAVSANFERAGLEFTDWRQGLLMDSSLRAAEMSAASLDGATASYSVSLSGGAGAVLINRSSLGASLLFCDLKDMQAHEASLNGAILRDSVLDGADLRSAQLRSATFRRGSSVGASFRYSDLRGATFVRTNLSRATFRGANLEGADFTLARGLTPSSFDMARGHFKAPDPAASQVKAGCAALPAFGASYPSCDLRARSWDGVNLEQASLDGADASRASMVLAKLSHASLLRASLAEADLRGASLNSARLDDADLTKAVLVGAELTEASLRRADFRMSQLGAAKVGFVQAEEADFSDAVAEKALFEGAAAPRAQFARARLAESHFNGARLVGASFAKADLVGASFKDAAVEGVDFTGALMDVTTDFTGAIGVDKVAAWPAGYSPPLG